MSLPAPRHPGHYAVGLVCLGNICRSPIAEAVLKERVEDAGLAEFVSQLSGGTGGWHVGDPMDPRAAATLEAAGYDTEHQARQVTSDWLTHRDLLLVMDAQNLRDVEALAVDDAGRAALAEGRVRLFRDHDPEGGAQPGREVPDPYYGGPDGFEEVLAMVERTCDSLLAEIAALPSVVEAVAADLTVHPKGLLRRERPTR